MYVLPLVTPRFCLFMSCIISEIGKYFGEGFLFFFFFCEIREVRSIFPQTICVCWCFVFIVYVCFFVSCASIRFDDSKQFSLAVVFIMSSLFLFLFYIRYYNNFCDKLHGRPFFVLRYVNLLLSKFGTTLNNGVIVSCIGGNVRFFHTIVL